MSFDHVVSQPIPLEEASDFFVRLTKKAEVEVDEAIIAAMREEVKQAAVTKEPPTDAELREIGHQRAVTNMAAESHREASRRGERFGRLTGEISGGALGGALGKKYLGGAAGTLGGTALGALAGRAVGGEIGAERDISKNASPRPEGLTDKQWVMEFYSNSGKYREKVAAMRFDRAMMKKAELGEETEAPMAPPTTGQQTQPTNYMQAEIMGQQAQAQNEAGYYRTQMGQMQNSHMALEQQTASMQEQLAQLQNQQMQSGEQMQQAMDEALAARDDALNAHMEMAKARLGAQEMRQAILDIVSQDPHTVGEGMMGPQSMPGEMPVDQAADAGQVPPPAEEGPAGSAAPPEASSEAAPPAGEQDVAGKSTGKPPGVNPKGAETTVSFKSASARLLGALGGAALGAGGSLAAGHNAGVIRDKVQELEASQDGSFRQAAELAAAKAGAASADLSQKHPAASALVGGLVGGLGGMTMGPAIADNARELAGHAKTIGRRVAGG
jgi:hypothetical protein